MICHVLYIGGKKVFTKEGVFVVAGDRLDEIFLVGSGVEGLLRTNVSWILEESANG